MIIELNFNKMMAKDMLVSVDIPGFILAKLEYPLVLNTENFYKHEIDFLKSLGYPIEKLSYVGYNPGLRDRHVQRGHYVGSTCDSYQLIMKCI